MTWLLFARRALGVRGERDALRGDAVAVFVLGIALAAAGGCLVTLYRPPR